MTEVARLVTPEGVRDDPDCSYRSKEAAAYLGVSVATLERWRRLGIGPIYSRTVPGNKKAPVIYLKRDLDAYKASGRVRSTSEESA